jgi:hypothetical protein
MYALVFAGLVVLALAIPSGTSRRSARQRARVAQRNAEIAKAMESQTTDRFASPPE